MMDSALEINTGGQSCLLCHASDSHAAMKSNCTTGEHYLCTNCFEASSKFGPVQNGCLFCTWQPACYLSTTVEPVTENTFSEDTKILNEDGELQTLCAQHPSETACFFCIPCNRLACDKCISVSCSTHKHVFLASQARESVSEPRSDITSMLGQARSKTKDLEKSMREAEDATMQLRVQFSKARLDVDAAYSFFNDQLRDRRVKLLTEIDTIFNSRWQHMSSELQEVRTHIDNLQEFANLVDTIILSSSESPAPDSVLLSIQAKLKSLLDQMLAYQPRLIDAASFVGELEFVSNRQAIQVAVQNCLGYVRQGDNRDVSYVVPTKLENGSSTPNISIPGFVSPHGCPFEMHGESDSQLVGSHALSTEKGALSDRHQSIFWPNDLGGYPSVNDTGCGNGHPSLIFSAVVGAEKKIVVDHASLCETWSINALTNSATYPSSDSLVDSIAQCGLPPVPIGLSTIKRQKMGYHCKFGEFGTRPGQFTEPSGIATNSLNDIIVADTNNHRLEVFDAIGLFKYEILGRQADCELVYPNRLAVCHTTGDIVVTERSPTHQVQMFDRCGNFLRRFGGKVLQHPRGVAVDACGRIVVVECRVMRVFIFDVSGAVINRFSLMGELEFPNGVAVDDQEQIYISDNRAHCIKVYNYAGKFVRTIGGAGVTNYPIGVGVDRTGHVVVADNHNNFNVTVFDSAGTLIRALESRVKHAHCYDMSLTGDGDIVVSSKDFRVYVYRYDAPVAPPGLSTSALYV